MAERTKLWIADKRKGIMKKKPLRKIRITEICQVAEIKKEIDMDRNKWLWAPPMGWNSYDYYNTEVNEAQVRANAEYMAANLKEYGWEYIVVDIQWYAVGAGSQSDKYQYIPFGEVVMDEYSRLIPDPARFPSSQGGKGFRPLADYIHSLGLKFGIHMMRGIPRAAAHAHAGFRERR